MSPFALINTLSLEEAKPLLKRLVEEKPARAPSSFSFHCKDFIKKYCDESLTSSEQLYLIFNPDANRHCEVCRAQLTKFRGPTRGWGNYCSIACSAKSETRKEKYKKTSLLKYGVVNPKANPVVNRKMQETNLEKYGHVCNLHANDKVKEISAKRIKAVIENLHKSKETNLKRYGVEWQTQRESFIRASQDKHKQIAIERDKERLYSDKNFELMQYNDSLIHKWKHTCGFIFDSTSLNLKCQNCTKHSSIIENEFYDFLVTLIPVAKIYRHHQIVDSSKRQVDFYIPECKLAIEINGTYWHRADIDCGSMLWKTDTLESQGIQLIHIWDKDLIENKQLIYDLIKSKLGKNEVLYARDTTIKEISSQQARDFLLVNHRQGYVNCSVKIGLFDKFGNLVSVLTLGKPRFSKKIEWEIIRLASSVNVIGGFNKMLKYFEKVYSPKSICTYADRAFGNGQIYVNAGFTFIRKTKPGYFWTNSTLAYVTRYDSQLKNLHNILGEKFDPSLSEEENMKRAKFWKCENVGNNYFEKLY